VKQLSDVLGLIGSIKPHIFVQASELLPLFEAAQSFKNLSRRRRTIKSADKQRVYKSLPFRQKPAMSVDEWKSRLPQCSVYQRKGRYTSLPPGAHRGDYLLDPELVAGSFKKRLRRNIYQVPQHGDDDWITIKKDENAVVIDEQGNLLLLVLRNASKDGSFLLQDVIAVIEEAVYDRRDVRPTEPGTMVQFGQGAGQRNKWIKVTIDNVVQKARVFGDVKNIKRKYSQGEREDKNRRILGVVGLFWNLALAVLPAEVMVPLEDLIEKESMPLMSAPGDRDKKGYTFTSCNKPLHFSSANRPPYEAYLTKNYVACIHTDKPVAPFALIWAVGREEGSDSFGCNFIDLSIRVRVMEAADTMKVFDPKYYHGTTVASGVTTHTLAITFSAHILQALKAARAAQSNGSHIDMEVTRYCIDKDSAVDESI